MRFILKRNMIIIKIKIDEIYYKFLVDTGSERSFIVRNKNIEKYKQNILEKIKVKGIGGEEFLKNKYIFPKINIDNTIIHKVEILEKKRNSLFLYLGIDGILGWDILKKLDLLIDIKNKIFSLVTETTQNKKIGTPIISDKQLVIEMKYKNDLHSALIDLGATESFVTQEVFNNYDVIWERNIVLGINGIKLIKVATIKNIILNIAGIEYKSRKLLIKSENFNWKFKLGMDFFENRKIFLKNSIKEMVIVE
ncbi:aspartyl protease family protein [Gemella sp. zg-1178]|uniref:aspartyl protease family protein n=1 Tax=Gemella sp. zg-1178 TaxID=2840372 RepID=UPI001C05C670|nr:aspartyl protease family protein [Gemella sp. zg-1178]MBU0278616.1 aspartyl protease family protein [Gemella sp. zg-1178]